MFEHERPNGNEGSVADDEVWRMFQKLLQMRANGEISRVDSAKAILALDKAQANANIVTVQTRLKIGKVVVGSVN